eukprot:93155_1
MALDQSMSPTDPSTLTSAQIMSWTSDEYIGDESSVQSMSKSESASQSPDKTTDQCSSKSESPPELSCSSKSESPPDKTEILMDESKSYSPKSKSHSPKSKSHSPESKDTKTKHPITPKPIAKSKIKDLTP